jgi:tRNA-dihydrouridine synthase B
MTQNSKLRIGNVELNNPFVLAPLAGITNSTYRRICKEMGASLVYSEMVSAKALHFNDKSTERLLYFEPEEKPICYQLFGSDPEIMAWAVDSLADKENSMIDINMGCPVRKVVQNKEGSALMKTPRLAAEIVKAMVDAEKNCAKKLGRETKPITVKCRLGWDEKNINVLEFAMLMEEAGASAICVHARTREQLYSGKADWKLIEQVKKTVAIPVIGSGDIFSAEDAFRMLEFTGCDFVMIARGALGNPWIFKEAEALYRGEKPSAPPSFDEKIKMMLRHLDMLAAEKGDDLGVLEMRKHIGWYIKGMPGATEMRRKINTIVCKDKLRNLLESRLTIFP